jgi:hypothetical protein
MKSLRDKTGLHTGDPGGFDTFTSSGKPLLKRQKSLPPGKHNNKLLANLIALKLNIAASALGKTPVGFGELIFDDGSNALAGTMVNDIARYGDSVMMGYYEAGVHKFVDTSKYNNLNYVVGLINSAFEGPVDTLDPGFTTKLYLKGTKPLVDVPYMRANPNVQPRIMAESRSPLGQEPDAYMLYQNYPNPFNPLTVIRYSLMGNSYVTLKVYNVLGQEVATLLDRELLDDGAQEVRFNASSLASGVYFYRIVAEAAFEEDEDITTRSSFTQFKKMLLVK